MSSTFKDGKRTVDFILVFKASSILAETIGKKHKAFLEGLQKLGIEQESEQFSSDEDVIFIKLHAPDALVLSYAPVFDIDLACQAFEYRPYVKPPLKCLATPLTNPNVNDPIYARAPDTISGDLPKKVTSAEKIMVVNQILQRCVWGPERGDYGINKLREGKVFLDAYPLHDGDYKWTASGPLNDRQLLALYWGSAKCWKKAQPLNLIERYFGTEHAVYFAWLGMYIKLLIPPAIMSIFVIIYGVITLFTPLNRQSEEVCASEVVICPRCHFEKCPMEYLRNSCLMANITYLFDNWVAVIFSAVVSIWATVFMEVWQREESVLRLQWNLKSLEYTVSVRPEYLERATKTRYSSITGKMEPYIPTAETVCRYTISLISVALLLLLMCAVTFGVMVYRVTINAFLAEKAKNELVTKKMHRHLIASASGSLMSGFFIIFFKHIYEKVGLTLNNLENHRTWNDYSNAFIYKSYALAFANNYAAVFYIALFKGKFFTHPGDINLYTHLGGIDTDVCEPTGCIVDLAILLIIIMSLKAFVNNVLQVVVPKLERKMKRRGTKTTSEVPQWETEYFLSEAPEFFIVAEYMDMVIQYGFVNFFIMGFPLAPLLALINNIAELRVDGSKVIKSFRRPVPTKVVGLGAWFGILQAMTYIGVVTNALVIAFTSNYMEKAIFTSIHGVGAKGFLNQTLSAFNMSEFEFLDNRARRETGYKKKAEVCYYPGKRYPPDHELKYQRRKDYWHHLGIKFSAVVIFEHIVIIIKGLLAYAIPDVPFSVKQQLVYQDKINKQKKTREIQQAFMKKREGMVKAFEEKRAKEKEEKKKKEEAKK